MTKIILQSVVLRSFVPLLVLEAQKILKFNSTEQFLDYLLSDACMHNGKRMMGTTANNNLTKLKCILAIAYEDGLLKENIAKKLVRAKAHGNKRQFLTKEELLRSSFGFPVTKHRTCKRKPRKPA